MRKTIELAIGMLLAAGVAAVGGCSDHHPDHDHDYDHHDNAMQNHDADVAGGNGTFGTDPAHPGSHDQEHAGGGM